MRVTQETRDRISALARQTGRPMVQVVEDAVKAHERAVFFEQVNRRYVELRDDPEAWAEIEEEREVWGPALGDRSL